MSEFIMNGNASGSVGAMLMHNGFDPGALRPYIGDDGRSYITVNENGKPKTVLCQNATATLRKDAWKALDLAIVKTATERLQLVSDIRQAGLTFNVPNGMGTTVFETETMSDISDASITMDGLAATERDRPLFELTNLPLPVTSKPFSYSLRQIEASRRSGSPLDTTTAELAGRKVAEEIEKLTLGNLSTYTYGGGSVYGLRNFPTRETKSMTLPTASSWTGATTVTEILQMRQQSYDEFHFGPFNLYTSPNWDVYLDNDFSTAKGDNTLRDRIKKIEKINNVTTLDFLTGFQMILVQMTSDVIRMVVGMEIQTIQWESHGGLKQEFQVMGIIVPQLRADQSSQTGIVHGTAT